MNPNLAAFSAPRHAGRSDFLGGGYGGRGSMLDGARSNNRASRHRGKQVARQHGLSVTALRYWCRNLRASAMSFWTAGEVSDTQPATYARELVRTMVPRYAATARPGAPRAGK